MAEITKLNLYLSEKQYHKLRLVAQLEDKTPEEVANNAVYSYLAITDAFEEKPEPVEGMHEVLFQIPDAIALKLMARFSITNFDDLDKFARNLLMSQLVELDC
ncbi:MAG: hypothetical protein IJH90_02330 [Mogibacterium sp.]|nr:hypothetical protein [Mogibacterium sp.]